MPFMFYAGKDAWVIVGGVRYPMREWQLSLENTRIDVTNFESAGDFREFLAGFTSGQVTAKGPFAPAVGALTPGSIVSFILGVGGAFQFTINNVALIAVKYSQNVEGAAEVEITGMTSGQFNVTF
jgi:hypothetical protein